MEKSITTAILTMAAVTVSLVLVNALVPRMNTGSEAAAAAATRLETRVRTDLAIVHATAETVEGVHRTRIWVKNIGSATVTSVAKMDLFVLNASGTTYYPNGTGVNTWQYTILEAEAETWAPGRTVMVELTLPSAAIGQHMFRLITVNVAEVGRTFSF